MTDHSHYHCWEQKQPPACGVKGEHKRCCLCEATRTSTFSALVQEWKEKLNKWLDHDLENNDAELIAFAFESFLERAMLAAAKGAADAGEVEKQKEPSHHLDLFPPTTEKRIAQAFVREGFNIAVSRSQQQLNDYFKGIL